VEICIDLVSIIREVEVKKLLMVLASIFFFGVTTLTLAQTNAKNPNAHAVHKHLRQQMKQIQTDLKAGRITEAQAKAKRDQLRAVHQQAVDLKRQNGGTDLTENQKAQLNNSMDKAAN
jgi:hypothetical protein